MYVHVCNLIDFVSIDSNAFMRYHNNSNLDIGLLTEYNYTIGI